jgi:hypothetical protein
VDGVWFWLHLSGCCCLPVYLALDPGFDFFDLVVAVLLVIVVIANITYGPDPSPGSQQPLSYSPSPFINHTTNPHPFTENRHTHPSSPSPHSPKVACLSTCISIKNSFLTSPLYFHHADPSRSPSASSPTSTPRPSSPSPTPSPLSFSSSARSRSYLLPPYYRTPHLPSGQRHQHHHRPGPIYHRQRNQRRIGAVLFDMDNDDVLPSSSGMSGSDTERPRPGQGT